MRKIVGILTLGLFLLVVLAFSFSNVSYAAEPGNKISDLPYGFKGVRWGATKEEFKKVRTDVPFIDGWGRSNEDFLGYNADITYHFNDDKLWHRMTIIIDRRSAFDKLGYAFIDVFGYPKDKKAHFNVNNVEMGFWKLKDATAVFCFAGDYSQDSGPGWKEAKEWVKKGDKLRGEKEYEKALECYNEAIKIKNNYRPAYKSIGYLYEKTEDYDKALENYTKYIDIDPEYAEGYKNRGKLYATIGDYDKTLTDYSIALKNSKESQKKYVYNDIAKVYYKMKDYAKAVETYTMIIDIDPDSSSAYKSRAYAYLAQGKQKEAIDDFSKVIELDPKKASSYNARAWTYYEMGEYKLGLKDVNKALKIKPDVANYLDTRSNIYRELGKYDKAMEDINKAIELKSDNSFFYYTRGLNYQAMGEKEKAVNDLKKACDGKVEDACEAYNKLSSE